MRSPDDRFWEKVDRNGGPTVSAVLGPCWIWKGAIASNGYGTFHVGMVGGRRHEVGAHVFAFGLGGGVLGPGEEVCHACDIRDCVRVDHLFAGTRRQNMLDAKGKGRTRNAHTGKTHCKRGHPFTPENTRVTALGRSCRECARLTTRLYKARRRAEARV